MWCAGEGPTVRSAGCGEQRHGDGGGSPGGGKEARPQLWGGTWRSLNGVRKVGRERRQVQGAPSCARCRRHRAEDVVEPIIKKKNDRCQDNTADHFRDTFAQFIKETA